LAPLSVRSTSNVPTTNTTVEQAKARIIRAKSRVCRSSYRNNRDSSALTMVTVNRTGLGHSVSAASAR
jgi:hypothetical protein